MVKVTPTILAWQIVSAALCFAVGITFFIINNFDIIYVIPMVVGFFCLLTTIVPIHFDSVELLKTPPTKTSSNIWDKHTHLIIFFEKDYEMTEYMNTLNFGFTDGEVYNFRVEQEKASMIFDIHGYNKEKLDWLLGLIRRQLESQTPMRFTMYFDNL